MFLRQHALMEHAHDVYALPLQTIENNVAVDLDRAVTFADMVMGFADVRIVAQSLYACIELQ